MKKGFLILMSTSYSTRDREAGGPQTPEVLLPKNMSLQLNSCLVSTTKQKAAIREKHYKSLSLKKKKTFPHFIVLHELHLRIPRLFLTLFCIHLDLLLTFTILYNYMATLISTCFQFFLILLRLGKHMPPSSN